MIRKQIFISKYDTTIVLALPVADLDIVFSLFSTSMRINLPDEWCRGPKLKNMRLSSKNEALFIFNKKIFGIFIIV